jgi:hypothetical protein
MDVREMTSEEMNQARRQIEAKRQSIDAVAVSVARSSLKDGQELQDRVAEYVCNQRHGGMDVWSMIKDQPDRAGMWLAHADCLIGQAQ